MSFIVLQFLAGLASAASLFLVACGLSLVFGVTRVVNFAHGSFYMLGAYLAHTLVQLWGAGPLGFWGAVIAAALAVGVFGVVIEVTLLRRLYRSPELLQLVATFAVVLVVQDLALLAWGPEDRIGPRAPGLEGAVIVMGEPVPAYDLFLVGLGPTVLAFVWLLLRRTRWGIRVRAATADRDMADALGVDQKRLFTSVFFLGAVLAGLGGAIQMPREPASLLMDLNIIAEAFVVVVIGGMGSVVGAFVAAVLIAELHAFGIVLVPEITLVLVFLVMAVVLIARPWGLFGRAETESMRPLHGMETSPMSRAAGRKVWALIGLGLLLLPAIAGPYLETVMAEVFIFALFAASLRLIIGTAGLVSFGHAAFLGIGAYAAALLTHHAGWPMAASLAAAPLAGAAGGAIIGWFCVRLSGVYLAMLTLAFAQILWSMAFQWDSVTGGDNGLLGIWPSGWASEPAGFYYMALVACGGAVWLLRRFTDAPFGYTLRAARDNRGRAEAIGIDARHWRWRAFVVAGGAAGLAGGLYAFLKGSVFPDVLSIPLSVDGLVMVLLGGVGAISGPLLGAAAFTGMKITLASETDFWRLILGTAIIALVLLFPRGLLGTLRSEAR